MTKSKNKKTGLRGLITEAHFDQAENEFPGIKRFFESCAEKPLTFLSLVWQFEAGQAS